MRIVIALGTLALIIVGGMLVWRSNEMMPGLALIVVGLAINTIMAASRHWWPSHGREKG